MAKKYFAIPTIILTGGMGDGGSGEISGPGSGQGNLNPDEKLGWWDWLFLNEDTDIDGNGTPGEWSDYLAWWQSHTDWTEEQFSALNDGAGYDSPEP